MAPPFAAPILLALFTTAVAAAPQHEGCNCEATCADIVARQQKEIARLQAELRNFRGDVDPGGRRLSCPTNVDVSNDAEVEALRLEGCGAIEKLKVSGSVSSLAGLSSLETAETTDIEIRETTSLRSLVGLEGLSHVRELYISENEQLTSLAGLQGLGYARTVSIRGNGELQSLTGLENLSQVEWHLFIQQNDRLRSLVGLQGLETIVGNIFIRSNAELQSFNGLENLLRTDILEINNNDQLWSLAGLRRLEAAQEVRIWDNSQLYSLDGLENLSRVEVLDIKNNFRLRSLAALQGLGAAMQVNIEQNMQLQSLTGLENLARVEGLLRLYMNVKLLSLDGLRGLESADEILLEQSFVIETLNGLENLVRVGKLTLEYLDSLRSIAALRGLTNIWHGGLLISKCPNLLSLDGLGTLSVSRLEVQAESSMQFLGGPFAVGSSVNVVRFNTMSWPRCFTPHERMSLLSVVEDKNISSVPNATWEAECGPDPQTFLCTKGQPCNFSLAGNERNYTSIFVSGRFRGCGACSVDHPRGDVGQGGKVNLGYVLRDEEAGLRSICRCTGWIGPVAQLLLRGPRQSVVKPCSRGRNCIFRIEGEALEPTDRVVLMRSCNSGDPSGFAPNLTADSAYLLHDPSTWYSAPATRYQICWRAPCTSAPDGPTCPAPEDSYFHVGDLELLGPYSRNYAPVLGEASSFAVPNIGLGVSDGDQMRLRRDCGEADEEDAYVLAAYSSGMVFDFGMLTEVRVQAGSHHLCWCHERDGAQCNAAWHFRADAGVVQIRCPAGQELVDSRRCESCPAGKEQPEPGLEPCLECPIGRFSLGGEEPCEVCPGGTVAGLPGSSACVACLAWQSADPKAAGCSPDPVMLVLLTLFTLSVGAFCGILVRSSWRRLLVVDVSLVQDQTIVTTFGSHGLTVGRPPFPVKFHGTGHPGLDSSSRAFQATVKDAVRLELLGPAGTPIKEERLDTSMGTLTVSFLHDLGYQRIVALGLPVLFTAAVALGALLLSAGLIAEALLGATCVALTCTASVTVLRWRPRATPLSVRVSEFKQKLGGHLHGSQQIEKGPNRAISIGKLHELLEFFQDFIRDRTAYYLDSNILRQLTQTRKVSYAELAGAGEVEWFVSHFWGTPFQHFCASLRKHAEMYRGQRDWETLQYWVCFCSNNQYQIQEELGGAAGWVESSFYLTLKSGRCRGTCMVLDDKAMPLTRVWCIFELLQTVKLERNSAGFEGLLLCTSGGVLNTGAGSPDVAMALAEKVGRMNLQTAQATSESDAQMIRDQVTREMGSYTALNHFICGEMRDMLVRAQQHANQHFVDVLALLDQTLAEEGVATV